MKWIIEYNDNKSISEDEVNFQFVDKENVKNIYFIDSDFNRYGVDCIKGTFFINNKIFDFKVKKEPERLIQFKRAVSILDSFSTHQISSWNIGYEVNLEDRTEKYILSINNDGSVYLNASKYDRLTNEVLDEKSIKLQ